jgi:hypothetical protein
MQIVRRGRLETRNIELREAYLANSSFSKIFSKCWLDSQGMISKESKEQVSQPCVASFTPPLLVQPLSVDPTI